MDPLHNIGSSVSKNEIRVGEHVKVNEEHVKVNEEHVKVNEEHVKVNEERVNISISKTAYEALVKHAKQITERNPETDEPFTIEEILDEEIMLLFNNDWKEG
jgi:16S rRNA U516 pseudouridylate synthase RsuA-like enzyme